MSFNPWKVESIKAFYYLKCPECNFDTKEESSFQDHAIENHPMSYELFGKKSVREEEFDSVMIKEEQMSDFDENKSNCEQINFDPAEMVDKGGMPEIGEVKKELIDGHLVSEDHITSDFDEKETDSGQFERDKLGIDLKKTKRKLQKSLIRNEELNSQSKRFKEVISFLIFEVEANGQDVLNTLDTLANELDVKTDAQFKVRDQVAAVKISIRKKNKQVKTESKKQQRKCVRRSKATMVFNQSHLGQKKFHCQYCEKGFVSNSLLKRHELIHTGERPYSCHFCEKCFNTKGSLKTHERIHTGEKPYSCKYCLKKFMDASDKNKHERIHTGEKP